MQAPNERIAAILAGLKDLERQEEALRADLAVQRSRLEIACASCGKPHAIKDLAAIQTHWYVSPYGCTGGDYWKPGEMQFICPETGVRNRLLFDNNDVDWSDRDKYEFNPDKQFRCIFGPLFKTLVDEHEDETKAKWVNNEFVNRNRAIFGLVARMTQKALA